MTGRYIRSTFVEHQREFVEYFPYGKQLGKTLDLENKLKHRRAPKHILLCLESEKSGNQVPNFENDETYLKFVHEVSVQNGSYAFPNELVRFRFEATLIWGNIQKHHTNAVTI